MPLNLYIQCVRAWIRDGVDNPDLDAPFETFAETTAYTQSIFNSRSGALQSWFSNDQPRPKKAQGVDRAAHPTNRRWIAQARQAGGQRKRPVSLRASSTSHPPSLPVFREKPTAPAELKLWNDRLHAQPRQCVICGKLGHVAKECPLARPRKPFDHRTDRPRYRAVATMEIPIEDGERDEQPPAYLRKFRLYDPEEHGPADYRAFKAVHIALLRSRHRTADPTHPPGGQGIGRGRGMHCVCSEYIEHGEHGEHDEHREHSKHSE